VRRRSLIAARTFDGTLPSKLPWSKRLAKERQLSSVFSVRTSLDSAETDCLFTNCRSVQTDKPRLVSGVQKSRVHEVDSVTRQPEVTVIVTSYNRRQHLRRCLLSLSRQRGLGHQVFEVVVADDGSSDGSCEMLRHLSRDLPYRVRVVSQEDIGFRRARALNQALNISEGDYLLLTDADCIFPNHYVQRQIAERKVGIAWAGDCVRLSKEVTQRITEGAIVSGDFMRLVPTALPTDQLRRHYTNRLYQWWNHPTKPKLIGFNIALWADDLRSINGLDQANRGPVKRPTKILVYRESHQLTCCLL
jgi:glycosyltransferase involved in cell wall biosynthesis